MLERTLEGSGSCGVSRMEATCKNDYAFVSTWQLHLHRHPLRPPLVQSLPPFPTRHPLSARTHGGLWGGVRVGTIPVKIQQLILPD